MEPVFYRGDILLLHMGTGPFRCGEVIMFSNPNPNLPNTLTYPIVHRIIKVHEKPSGEVDLLTKGDNNLVDDRSLYNPGQSYINKRHVMGKVKGYLPYLGMVTIIANDYPALMYLLIGTMCLLVLGGL